MKERLDCAMVNGSEQDTWAQQWLGAQANGRLYLHFMGGNSVGVSSDSVQLLAASAKHLSSYDACILLVSPQNLSWARTALVAANGLLKTPVVVIARELKAAALDDLYKYGVHDFVRDPLCFEELRVRLERALKSRDYPLESTAPHSYVSEDRGDYEHVLFNPTALSLDAFCENILDRSGIEIEAFAAASASRSATSKESFRSAKSKLIARFERAYIAAALGRHAGNVAMAARYAQKHRRAFWELMKKHKIDANHFRARSCPKVPQDG